MQVRRSSERSVSWVLGAILLIRLVLGTAYSLIVPAWESHDEWGHYAFVHYLATQHSLPSAQRSTAIEHDETAQPPLYYILAAAATAWIDTGDFSQPPQNPYVGNPEGTGGVNFALHTDAEGWPFRGTFLALHVARFVSVLLSTFTVWLAFLCARIVFRRAPVPTLVATAVVAFWPEYVFVGSMVTNDGIVVTAAALVLLFALRCVAEWPPRTVDLLGLGAAAGIAALTKHTALGLIAMVPVVLLVLGVRAIRRRTLPRALILASIGAVLALAVGGWWYARNLAEGGSLTLRHEGLIASLKLLVVDPTLWLSQLQPVEWGESLRYGFLTFSGSFGWGNVGAPSVYYYGLGALLLLGLVGCLVSFRGRSLKTTGFGLVAVFAVLCPLPHVYLMYFSAGATLRGRMLLSLLLVAAIVIGLGLDRLSRWRGGRLVLTAIGVALLAWAIWVPFGVIRPAYAGAPTVQEAAFSGAQYPVNLLFGDDVRFLGYDFAAPSAVDDRVELTLYWAAAVRPQRDYTVRIALLAGGTLVGGYDAYPGRGTAPTSGWSPGQVVVDTIAIPLDAPVGARVLNPIISVLERETGQRLSAVDSQGHFVATRVELAPITVGTGR